MRMKVQNDNRTSFRMPMIELVIIIGIFAFISLLIVQMFFGANKVKEKAIDISKSMIQVETIAENIKAATSFGEAETKLSMAANEGMQNTYVLYYNHKWERTIHANENLILVRGKSVEGVAGTMLEATISAYAVKEEDLIEGTIPISQVTVKKFVRN